MIKFCWHNVIVVFLLIFITSLLTYYFLFNRMIVSQQINTTKDMQSKEAISLPKVTMSVSKMNDRQKQKIVYQAHKDAIASALASGQNNEQAQKFAAIVIRAISE
ncbi:MULTISPECIES: hypothetical protein [unclassified Bartonella]|uniref:hypothetical protein n=1 Tax=unclassified Bartonella TaxID=2645622 RepID=UPI00099978EE|nr:MULTISPECIES: hypothetical protein [unclassified Bartonella]AQX28261.1 hypothetical protein BJB15x_008710 [Bartonella sp. JB15]AQX29532.1 hypothetical protein BJB63x_008610 [Bartonella sp. JB63]